MNHKLLGRNLFRTIALLILMAGAMSACSLDKIAGDPGKVLREYIEAIQKGDFKAIYARSQVTVRQHKLLEKSETGDVEKQQEDHYLRHKAIYDAASKDMTGVQWAEKFFFPPSAKVEIGKPHNPVHLENKSDDAYEKGVVAVLTVSVTYPVPEEAPEYNGTKLKYAEYNCMMRKIRQEDSVMIYSYDDKWFFSGCIMNSNSAR